MTNFSLKKYGTRDIIFSGEFSCITECVEAAVEQGICLDYVDLRGVNLMNAEMDEACLRHARFDYANLTGANMSGAKLEHACFNECTIYNTCFCEAIVSGAQFFGASFGGTDIAWADLKDTSFDTLSALELQFSDSLIMKGAMFYDRTGVICDMSHAPIIIKGLQYPIVLFDEHMKVGPAVLSYYAWTELKNRMDMSGLDKDLLAFLRVYGGFLFTLATIRSNGSFHVKQNNRKNVA